jgi:hypothetical protein
MYTNLCQLFDVTDGGYRRTLIYANGTPLHSASALQGRNDKVELRGEVEDLGGVHNNDGALTCLSHSRCAEKGISGCSGA